MKLKTIELLKWIIHFFITELPIIIKCKIQDRRFIYNGNRMCQFDVPIFLTRFTHALNTPIHNRCAELTILIDRCGSKELQNIFPTLIENIFGTSGGVCWGLRNITQSTHPNEFTVLHHFLGPLGPLFRLIYKLLTDSQVKYEYSVAHLPNKVRQILENSKIPPFYTDLLNIETQSRKVHSLCLNSFDYYMFHFAYHLTNVWQQRSNIASAWSMWNTVYYVLSCDYMLHFLPTDPNIIILPRLVHFTGKNPTIIPPPSVTNRPQYTSKLFRHHVLQQTSSDISALHQPMQQHPRSEIWRSETVVQIFIDMWLNNDQINNIDSSFNLQSKINQLPTGEYIRIIRVFVKQLHAFSASGRLDTSPLGELKKIVQPMLQGPIYAFLRHLVYRWPLDGSFRLVLELWLSFIQPWRYLGDNQTRNQENEIEDLNTPHTKFIDQHYIGFIADNLLAYTVIFQQLLPRFSRIDLSSPKNSLMLFRVCKVFGQPNLVAMIREIESCICIDNINHSPTHSYNPMGTTILLPPLSPTSCWSTNTAATSYHHQSLNSNPNPSTTIDYSIKKATTNRLNNSTNNNNNNSNNKWAAIVRHRIYELEGSEFSYKPMFVGCAAPEIFELLKQIQLAEPVARDIIKQRLDQNNKEYSNMFSSFFKTLFEIEDTNNDEFTLDERKKVPVFLSTAKMNLIEMFELQNENITTTTMENNYNNTSSEEFFTSTLNNSLSSSFDLSPNGARLRAKSLRYEGDPDLHPIKSNENAFLVRMLYTIAQKINDANRGKFSALYFRSDFVGKMSRQILCSPLLTHTYDKQRSNGRASGYSPRVSKTLPPRLSFRIFASHRILAYFVIGFSLFRYYGLGLFTYIFVLTFIWLLFVVTKATFERKSLNRFNCNTNIDFTNALS